MSGSISAKRSKRALSTVGRLATAPSICSYDQCINAWVFLATSLPPLDAEHGQRLAEPHQISPAQQHHRVMMTCSSTVRSAHQGTVQAIHFYLRISPASARADFSPFSCPEKNSLQMSAVLLCSGTVNNENGYHYH